MLNLSRIKKFSLRFDPLGENSAPYRSVLFLLNHPYTKETILASNCKIETKIIQNDKNSPDLPQIEAEFVDGTNVKLVSEKMVDILEKLDFYTARIEIEKMGISKEFKDKSGYPIFHQKPKKSFGRKPYFPPEVLKFILNLSKIVRVAKQNKRVMLRKEIANLKWKARVKSFQSDWGENFDKVKPKTKLIEN
ncbi:hypothetical protein MHBO_001369 [Bonamia ostreae]|uniref:Uncharacterized protein n=1 Tax=Bonamia ostreae TaxID=126728 RepID=A0ABV2AIR6_9EUKA